MNWADYVDGSFDEEINCSLFFSLEAPYNASKQRKFNKQMFTKPKRRRGKTTVERKTTKMNSKGETMNKNLKKLYKNVYSKKKIRI
jgi:hypothetical protein